MEEILAPNKHWENFFNKIIQFKDKDIYDWNEYDILGYLVNKYETTFNRKYSFSFNTKAPSKCSEIYFVKCIFAQIGKKTELIKEYIDWVFENEVVKKRKNITTFAIFKTPGISNKFLGIIKERNKVTRTTPLPEEYLMIINKLDLPLQTYGDLEFVRQTLVANTEDQSLEKYRSLYNILINLGLKENILINLEN